MFVHLLLFSTIVLSYQQQELDDDEAVELAKNLMNAYANVKTLEDVRVLFADPYYFSQCYGKTYNLTNEILFWNLIYTFGPARLAYRKRIPLQSAKFLDAEKNVLQFIQHNQTNRLTHCYERVARRNENGTYLLESEDCIYKQHIASDEWTRIS